MVRVSQSSESEAMDEDPEHRCRISKASSVSSSTFSNKRSQFMFYHNRELVASMSEANQKPGLEPHAGDVATKVENTEGGRNTSTGGELRPGVGEEGKPTIGEELFLVHLSRDRGGQWSEDDFDSESPRKRNRSVSVGEELWNVHLCRNRGMEQDIDEDERQPKEKRSGVSAPNKTRSDSKSPKPVRCSDPLAKAVLHLRSRDVQKTLIS